jgi:hypothetical protein
MSIFFPPHRSKTCFKDLIMVILDRPEWVGYCLYSFNFDPISARGWRGVSHLASRAETSRCRPRFKPVWGIDVDRTTSNSLNIIDELIHMLSPYWLVVIANSEPDV